MSAGAAGRLTAKAGLSSNPSIIRRNVLRKLKRGLDRLPSQPPDPAISESTPNGWRIAAAAIVERYPTIYPLSHPFEERYLRGRFEWQSSVARPAAEELFQTDRDGVEGGKSTQQTSAEMYVPAPVETEADERGDVKSLDRALRERLYFLTKRSPKSKLFGFPQTLVTSPDVPMREYAELALLSSFPPGKSSLRVHFISHMPATHLEHAYPREYQEKTGFYGVKMFFYRAQVITGDVGEVAVDDYAWARECELEGKVGRETYHAVKPALFGVANEVPDLEVEYEEGIDAAQY